MFEKKLLGVLMAAGQGTRLRPLTETTPKPLLKVQDFSLIEWNLQKMSPIVDKIVIVIGYLGQDIIDKLGYEYAGKEVEYVWQTNSKGGTLDAFRTAVFSSKANQEADYLVMNSDDLHGHDIFVKIQSQLEENREQALVAAKKLDDLERLKNFGVFKITENSELITVVEHPTEFVSNLVNTGIYYLPNKILGFFSPKSNLTNKEEYITNHLFNPYIEKYPIQVLAIDYVWLPVSNLQDYEWVCQNWHQSNS